MPKLPRVNSKRVIAALRRARFYIHHQTGSHVNLRSTEDPELHVVIPYHTRDLAPKTLKSIILQSGLTVEEFIRFL